MTVMPTMEGGLRLGIEDPGEWDQLEHIVADAVGDGDAGLAKRLGNLMDDDSDWEEVVVPELQVYFSEQLGVVTRAVRDARNAVADAPDEEGVIGEIFIKRSEAEDWYGALNQARLGLESRFQFGPSDALAIEQLGVFTPEELRGFLRMRLYAGLQGILLDHAMD